MVVLQDGQANPEDDLQALERQVLLLLLLVCIWENRSTVKYFNYSPLFPTSYMKMSKMRVATGSGRKVRKRVRNQEEAYMEV